MLKGVSTEIDYKLLIKKDESKAGVNLYDERVQVNSFIEDIKYIHEFDKSRSMMKNATQVDHIIGTHQTDKFDSKRKLDEK
jgi:hypothetical protein